MRFTTCSHFFTAIRWQVEGEHREERDPHAGDDEIDSVKKRLSSHRDVERYV